MASVPSKAKVSRQLPFTQTDQCPFESGCSFQPGTFISSATAARSSRVSCRFNRGAWCGCIPARLPVSKKACSPLWRNVLITARVYSVAYHYASADRFCPSRRAVRQAWICALFSGVRARARLRPVRRSARRSPAGLWRTDPPPVRRRLPVQPHQCCALPSYVMQRPETTNPATAGLGGLFCDVVKRPEKRLKVTQREFEIDQ